MNDRTHTWAHDGEVVTFSWLGDADVVPDRVYAFAFDEDGKMLLVTDPTWTPKGWLPGGGIEAGETPRAALERELLEEANATVHDLAYLGSQRAEDSAGNVSFQAFYWCRVTVGEHFAPEHEVTERMLVAPSEFLDALFWGRSDPKAPQLLRRSIDIDQLRGTID